MDNRTNSSIYDILIPKEKKKKVKIKKYYLTITEIRIIFILSCLLIAYLGYGIYYSYTYDYIKYIFIWFYIFEIIAFVISSLTIFSSFEYEYKDKLIIDETYTLRKSKFFEYISYTEIFLTLLYLINIIIYIFVVVKNVDTFPDKSSIAKYGMISFLSFLLSAALANIYIAKIYNK